MLLLLIAMFSITLARGQNDNIDSLIKMVNESVEDTNQMKLLGKLADTAPDGVWQGYNEKLGKLAEKLSHSKNAATQKIGKKCYALYLNNLGFINTEKANYYFALDCFEKCIKIQKEIKDSAGLCLALNSIGAIYDRVGELDKALLYYNQVMRIDEAINDMNGIIATLNNIGIHYSNKNDHILEMENYRKAEKYVIDYHLSNQMVPTLLNNIAINLRDQGEDIEAQKYFQKALDESNKIGDNKGKSGSLIGLAEIYDKQGKTALTFKFAMDALAIAKNAHYPTAISKSTKILKGVYLEKGDYKNAFEMYSLEMIANDSLRSKENQKAVIHHQFQTDYEIKQAKEQALQEKKDALATKEIQLQKRIRNYVLSGLGIVILFLFIVILQRNRIKKEKNRSEELLLNILPTEVANELMNTGSSVAKQFDQVTVMFTDFKGFSYISEKLSPTELVSEIDICFKAFDRIIGNYNIEKIKTIGDSYMCAGGLPVINQTNAKEVVMAALDIQAFIKARYDLRIQESKLPFEIRIGIHTGPVVAGIVGIKKFAYDIWGDTVNIASRMESSSEAGKVNISETTYELVKSFFICTHRGKIQAKNKGEIDMYFVESKS